MAIKDVINNIAGESTNLAKSADVKQKTVSSGKEAVNNASKASDIAFVPNDAVAGRAWAAAMEAVNEAMYNAPRERFPENYVLENRNSFHPLRDMAYGRSTLEPFSENVLNDKIRNYLEAQRATGFGPYERSIFDPLGADALVKNDAYAQDMARQLARNEIAKDFRTLK